MSAGFFFLTEHAGFDDDLGSPATVIGAIVTAPIIITAIAVKAVGTFAYQTGKNILDASQVLAEEKNVIKDLSNKVKEYSAKEQNREDSQKTLDKILDYFNKNNTLLSKEYVLKQISGVSSVREKIKIGYKFIEIETRYTVLREHFYSLLDLNKKINGNIDDIVNAYNQMSLENPDFLEGSIDSLLIKIKNKFSSLKTEFENQLKNKVYENEFINVEETEERLLLSVFDSELHNMLECNDDSETIELINKKNTLSILMRVYNACSNICNYPCFAMYADKVLALWSKAIKLSNRNDISIEDYRYEMDLIAASLDQIERDMTSSKKDIYVGLKTFNDLIATNNAYRKFLHLEISQREFNVNSFQKDIEELRAENVSLEKELQRNEVARAITEKIIKKYAQANYKFIVTSEPNVVGEHVFLKTYLITPDEKNVVCLTVNESGNISGEVVGAKFAGLSDDVLSIFESQKVFCSHTKAVLKNLFSELKIEAPEVLVEEPDLHKTTRSRDFSNILPPSALDAIKDARTRRMNEEKKKRMI